MDKPYFHELTEEQLTELYSSSMTWGDLMQKYSQPDWCEYPNALEGPMGCWGLVYRHVNKHGKDYCKTCEFNKDRVNALNNTSEQSL